MKSTTVGPKTPAEIPPPPALLFNNLQRQHGFEPAVVEGKLPEGLQGTLYRNGVGILEQFDRRYEHVFESDGAITAIRFSNGRAFSAARVTESAGLIEERRAGRHLGSFAAAWPTRMRRMHNGSFKNTANTHVIPWQGRLFALMEGGRPTEIDPLTLHTLGATDLGGVVGPTFSAHPHRIEKRRALYNFGMSYGKRTQLNLYVLPDEGPAESLGHIPLDQPVMLHDFIVTDKHMVFFVTPVRIVVWRMLLALRPFQQNFRWTPDDGTEIIVVPIDAANRVTRFRVDPFHVFHFASGFDDGGDVVVDYVRYPDSRLLGALGDGRQLTWNDPSTELGGTLHRARIDLKAKRFQSEPRWDDSCEFPRIDDRFGGSTPKDIWLQSARHEAGVTRFYISRIDERGRVRQHPLGPGLLCSEPVLAPASQSGNADSLLTLVFDSFARSSHLLVLHAHTLAFQARVQLSQAIPLTFHGSWVAA